MKKISHSPEETKAIAARLAKSLKNKGTTILLTGELGAGKTQFVQGFAWGLGIKERVLSPSFVYMRTYPLANKQALIHIDLYRLPEVRSLEELGLGEIFTDKDSFILIEWAEKLAEHRPKEAIKITINRLDPSTREILIED